MGLPTGLQTRSSFFNAFDGMVVSGEETQMNPGRQIYEILLERYNLKAKACLFIDDNFNNILTAKGLGFQTIHFIDGVNLKTAFQQLNIL